ncbi:unnamed protein product [Ambrosiozyma monospora]|uniref:Unnamed protein product n=1 Tax=Ambrosiozyma monospora TaxID=43982 RepID=A0ACB5T2N9_AMBMO|nr:unnamed protein product [Ambrosiozyma monospora]
MNNEEHEPERQHNNNPLYIPERENDPTYLSPKRRDTRSVFHIYLNYYNDHRDHIDDVTFGVPAMRTLELLGKGRRFRVAMLHLETCFSRTYMPAMRCWLFCLVSLPEWHHHIVLHPNQVNRGFGTQSTFSTSNFVEDIRTITLAHSNNIPILRHLVLGSFPRQLIRKVKTATGEKMQELQESIKSIDFNEFSVDTPETEIQYQVDSHGRLVASLINFVQSPDETMEYEDSLEYVSGGVDFPIADDACSPDGFIYCPSRSSNQIFIIKAFETKRPFIEPDVSGFPNVSQSKKFIHQVLQYGLSTHTTLVDLLDCSNYFVYGFDFQSFLNDADETLFYGCVPLNTSLFCAMAASTYHNVVHINEIKVVEYANVTALIRQIADRGPLPVGGPVLGHGGGHGREKAPSS